MLLFRGFVMISEQVMTQALLLRLGKVNQGSCAEENSGEYRDLSSWRLSFLVLVVSLGIVRFHSLISNFWVEIKFKQESPAGHRKRQTARNINVSWGTAILVWGVPYPWGTPTPQEGIWSQRLRYPSPEGTWAQRLEFPPPPVAELTENITFLHPSECG